MSREDAWAIAIAANITVVCLAWYASDLMKQQTALLTRIAVASEQTARQTQTPVDIRLAGFTPETQDALEDALKPNKRGK